MNILFFLLGFLSTLQIFKYQIFGANMYPFDLIYYSLIIILFVRLILNKKDVSHSISKVGIPLLIIFFLYYLFSVNLFFPIFDSTNSKYIMVALKFFIKKLIFLLFFLLIYFSNKETKSNFIKYFINGFFISVLVHSVYSYFTLFFWYFQELDIHTKWLNIIGITENSVGHGFRNFIYYPILRTTGLHWDPAYFGLWGIIGMFCVFIKSGKPLKKLILLLLIFVPWVFTFSRSAVFGLIAVIIILIIISFRKKILFEHIFNSVNAKSVLILSVVIIPLVIFLSVSVNISFKDILKSRIEVTEDIHTQKHIQYPFMAGKALLKDPFHFVFGYGNRNSGRAVEKDIIAIQENFNSRRAFDVESDIVRIPVNTGILGFSFYLLFISAILFELMRAYKKNKNELNLFVFFVICATFFAGYFYAYNDSVWVWMFYAIAIFLLGMNNRTEELEISSIQESMK